MINHPKRKWPWKECKNVYSENVWFLNNLKHQIGAILGQNKNIGNLIYFLKRDKIFVGFINRSQKDLKT